MQRSLLLGVVACSLLVAACSDVTGPERGALPTANASLSPQTVFSRYVALGTSLSLMKRLLYTQTGDMVTERSIGPDQYGRPR